MLMKRIVGCSSCAALSIAIAIVSACSSDPAGGPVVAVGDAAADTALATDASPPDAPTRDPNANCVRPGTPNNEKGFGGACTSSADCPSDLGFRLCTADVPDTPDNAWFCTAQCAASSECGTGVRCLSSDRGSGCVPISCSGDPSMPDAQAPLDASDQ